MKWITVCLTGFLLLGLLAGCRQEQPTTPPALTPVRSNRAWTPVIENIDGVEMVLVPAGCFMMGAADGRRDEQPEHPICFQRPFWIDRYEVTNAQFGSHGGFAGEQRPRENLTWFDARDFCQQRGARLPSEAEWEYAARGPESWLYPWGQRFDEDRLVFDGNFNSSTADVGSYPQGASWVGAYDMSGNVWEWVSSLYLPYPYDPADGREDPNSTAERRVYRGGLGSYIDDGTSAAKRFRADPFKTDWFLGFRCAKDG